MGLEIWETVKSGFVRTPTRLDPIQKITEKNPKKLLTSSHKGAIIKSSKGETPHTKKGIDTMEKMTYVKALDVAISAIADGEAKDKLVALKASIAKKNGAERKPTATQTANEGFKVAILDAMEDGKGYTITDLMKSVDAIADLSNQRVSAIVRQMVESGDVVREEIKRKAYFTRATSTDEVEGE